MENFQEELIKVLTKMRSTLPVGTPWWGFDVKSKPLGVQLYQGQILARDMYPVHWNYIQTYRTIVSETEWHTYAEAHNGFCPYFSSGDEVGTYRMPMIVDVHPRFIREGEDVGKFVEPGLPNITGYAGFTDNDALTYRIKADSTSGAFYGKEVTGMYPFNSNTSSVVNFGEGGYFDAARCSPIYGSSDTVQPPAINMLIGEYVVSGYQEFSLTTADEIKNGIDALQTTVGTTIREDRLNVILEKYNKSYIIDTWKSGTEWYRIWSDGWIEQGGVFQSVAGANQTFTFPTPFNSVNYYMFATNFQTTDAGICVFAFIPSTNTSCLYCTAYNGSFFSEQFRWYACGY